ncbi:hypothetical protein EDB81DRAFT_842468 [Dactylonectria macrodidyma]|uniref:Uncharacterized protein n=1 Tax=Dactylonectria macrodidyma TaxID=307937 RepID=A0A9P9EX56_9HYPO|nr:hypothetical protein EDB81DRAFT_842468 [Dactylonectria macrodidyma]
MSWLCRDPEISQDQLQGLAFEPRESRALVIEGKDVVGPHRIRFGREQPQLTFLQETNNTQQWSLGTDEQWNDWLAETPVQSKSIDSSRLNLILGGRAERPWGESPGLISKLPWSQQIFEKVKDRMFIHALMVRAIQRNTSCMFTRMWYDWKQKTTQRSLVYHCRTDVSWPRDMALSVTFLPDTLTTNAVLFGCDNKTTYVHGMTLSDIIISRLSHSDLPILHPMLVPAIFADIERDRQIELVREKLTQLGRRISTPDDNDESARSWSGQSMNEFLRAVKKRFVSQGKATVSNNIEDKEKTQASSDSSPKESKPRTETVVLWLEIGRLRIGLGNWQRQLRKMIEHVEELNEVEFTSNNSAIYTNNQLQQFRQAGTRIKERLQELVDEYDEYIRECSHIKAGVTLASQLELSHIGRSDANTNLKISRVNLDVAEMTRRDGRIMRSIAGLGMIFLPATFVTAFFSMGFFDWNRDGTNAGGASGDIGIYSSVVIALTLLSVGLFYVLMWKARQQEESE